MRMTQHLMRTSLTLDTSVTEVSRRSHQFFSKDMSQIAEKRPMSQCSRTLRKFLDTDLEGDDSQNLISLVLPCPQIVLHIWWNFHEDLITRFTFSALTLLVGSFDP